MEEYQQQHQGGGGEYRGRNNQAPRNHNHPNQEPDPRFYNPQHPDARYQDHRQNQDQGWQQQQPPPQQEHYRPPPQQEHHHRQPPPQHENRPPPQNEYIRPPPQQEHHHRQPPHQDNFNRPPPYQNRRFDPEERQRRIDEETYQRFKPDFKHAIQQIHATHLRILDKESALIAYSVGRNQMFAPVHEDFLNNLRKIQGFRSNVQLDLGMYKSHIEVFERAANFLTFLSDRNLVKKRKVVKHLMKHIIPIEERRVMFQEVEKTMQQLLVEADKAIQCVLESMEEEKKKNEPKTTEYWDSSVLIKEMDEDEKVVVVEHNGSIKELKEDEAVISTDEVAEMKKEMAAMRSTMEEMKALLISAQQSAPAPQKASQESQEEASSSLTPYHGNGKDQARATADRKVETRQSEYGRYPRRASDQDDGHYDSDYDLPRNKEAGHRDYKKPARHDNARGFDSPHDDYYDDRAHEYSGERSPQRSMHSRSAWSPEPSDHQSYHGDHGESSRGYRQDDDYGRDGYGRDGRDGEFDSRASSSGPSHPRRQSREDYRRHPRESRHHSRESSFFQQQDGRGDYHELDEEDGVRSPNRPAPMRNQKNNRGPPASKKQNSRRSNRGRARETLEGRCHQCKQVGHQKSQCMENPCVTCGKFHAEGCCPPKAPRK